MKHSQLLVAVALAAILLNGCATSTRSSRSSEIPQTMSSTANLSAVKTDVANLRDQVRLLEMRAGTDVSADAARLRAESQRLVYSVGSVGGQEGQSLRQQLDYVNARLDQLEAAGRQAQVAPSPVAGSPAVSAYPGQTAGPYQGQPTEPAAPGVTPAAPDQPNPYASRPAPTGTSTPVPPPSAKGPYEDGKSYFDQKQYGEAISQFRHYLAADPKGANAATAQFYIGESLYAQQHYEDAILEYQKVVRGFPKSSQMPTSLLKQGLSFQALGDKDSAKLLYQKVVRDFPKSYAAGVAKERLGKL